MQAKEKLLFLKSHFITVRHCFLPVVVLVSCDGRRNEMRNLSYQTNARCQEQLLASHNWLSLSFCEFVWVANIFVGSVASGGNLLNYLTLQMKCVSLESLHRKSSHRPCCSSWYLMYLQKVWKFSKTWSMFAIKYPPRQRNMQNTFCNQLHSWQPYLFQVSLWLS